MGADGIDRSHTGFVRAILNSRRKSNGMRRSRGMENLRVDHSLDARGMESAASYRKAVAQLKTMAENAIVELSIDDGEALRTIPFGLLAEGHE